MKKKPVQLPEPDLSKDVGPNQPKTGRSALQSNVDRAQETTQLRRKAEERLKKHALPDPSEPPTAEQLLHELQVHQIELEMQNEELRRAQLELEASQSRYFDLFDLAPVGYVMLSDQGLILDANLTLATLLGVTRIALVRQMLTHFILPEYQGVYYHQHKQLFETEAPQVCELRMLRAGAEPFWARLEATIAQEADGAAVCHLVVEDITELKRAETRLLRANHALKVLIECNRVLIHSNAEAGLLQQMCEIIVNIGEYRMAWVGFAEQDSARNVRPVAQSGFEDAYLSLAQFSWADEERGRGPTGTAIREGVIQVNQNFLTNPKLELWRAAALSRGYQASIALPLKDESATFGALNIYSAAPEAFDEEEVRLLNELANDLAFGIKTIRGRAERLRAEAAVRQLSSIVEQTDDTVVVTDRNGVIEYVNPAFEHLTGYAREEALGKTPRLLKSGSHDDRFYKGLWDTIFDGDHFRAEMANRKKSGELYYEVKTITPLWDAQGNVTHFVSTGKDITEHKLDEEKLRKAYDELELRVLERTEELREAISELEREIAERKLAEEALRQSEQRFRLVLQNAPIVVTNLDRDLRYTWVFNPKGGFTSIDILGKQVGLTTDPETTKNILDSLRRVISQGASVRWESISRTSVGEIYFESYAEPLMNDAGEITGVAMVSIDITERKRAEEHLAFQAKLLANIMDVVYATDEHLQLTFWNRAAESLYGWKEQEVLGKNVLEVVDSQVDPEKRTGLTRELMEKGLVSTEIEHRTRSGRLVFFESKTILLRDENGKTAGLVSINHDITEQKQAETELRGANEELTRFNRAMLGRELRMIELKKEVNELCRQAGQPPQYPLDFEKEGL